MKALGVDLSTDPMKTWICLIATSEAGAELIRLDGDHDDQSLLELMAHSDVVGIDCPLGWPDPFVLAVAAHAAMSPWPGRAGANPSAYRRTLLLRATDLAVKDATGINPLSVSANLLGATAMRCALLQDALVERGFELDRTGHTGRIVEVYPRAALEAWGLAGTGYKGSAKLEDCALLADRLLASVEGLSINSGCIAKIRRNDDALDAFVSALVALDARQGAPAPIPEALRERARREGWIHVPSSSALLVA